MLKSLINSFLEKFDLELRRKSFNMYKDNYLELIKETELSFKEFVFEDYISDEKRTKLMLELDGTNTNEALYLIYHLGKTMAVEGDICEFGVAQGKTSVLIANEIINTKKKFWLFDSFEGLSKPSKEDELINDIFNLGTMEAYEGKISFSEKIVLAKLKAIGFPLDTHRLELVKGFIEETVTKKELPEKVAFAYVDFDFYEPIKTALNMLHSKLSIGACVMVDDYGFFSSGVKKAVDEFYDSYKENYQFIAPYKFAGHFIILKRTT